MPQIKRLTDRFILFCFLTLAPFAQGSGNARLRVAITGDPQNYFTTQDVGDDLVVFRTLVDAQIADIIAYRPNLAIVAGDLTDSSGGRDQNCAGWSPLDDNDDTMDIFPGVHIDGEWANFRTYEYDRLTAAGISLPRLPPQEYTRAEPQAQSARATRGRDVPRPLGRDSASASTLALFLLRSGHQLRRRPGAHDPIGSRRFA